MFHRRVRTLCPYGQGIGINLISSGRLKMLKEENKWWELNEERQEGRSRSRLLADHRPLHILSTHYVAADIFRDQIFGVKLWGAHLAEGGLRFSGGFFGGWGWVGEWRGQLSFLQQSAANHRHHRLINNNHHRLINNNHHRLINNNQHLRSTTTNTWDQQQLTQIDQQGDAVSVSYYRHISKYKLYRNLQILPAKLAKSFFSLKRALLVERNTSNTTDLSASIMFSNAIVICLYLMCAMYEWSSTSFWPKATFGHTGK